MIIFIMSAWPWPYSSVHPSHAVWELVNTWHLHMRHGGHCNQLRLQLQLQLHLMSTVTVPFVG